MLRDNTFRPPRLLAVPVSVRFMPAPSRPPIVNQTPTPTPTHAQTPPAPGLAWLLGYGLNRAAVQGSTTYAVGPSGEVVDDPAVAQSWRHTQSHFCQPASRPVAAPVQSLRDQARFAATDRLRDGFKARLDVVPAPAGASAADRWSALRKSMATAYLLGLPVSAEMISRLPMVEQWTAQQVFGCPASHLVAVLRRLKAETLAELGLNRIPPGDVHDEVAQAARDFQEYADECIDNVDEMRRSDGSRRRQLSAATLAQIRITAATLG